MASIEDLTKQNLDLTKTNLGYYDEAERSLADQIRAMLATQDSMLKHEAALGISQAAEAYGTAGGGGELNKRYYLTQRENPSAVLGAMQSLTGLKQGFTGARAGEGRAQQAAGLNLASLGLQKEHMTQQEASLFEKIMAGVGGVAQVAGAVLPFLSTKEAKKNIKKASPDKMLADLKEMEVKEYEYKPGMGPMGKHMGMIIEENPKEFAKGQVALDASDLYSFIGTLTGAVQALEDKVLKLEGRG